ncbi:hypothetical protein CVT26_015449 [Gymnopilus dilepis]|uniref:Ubiquitin-like protease family profile domain-containing protein n=1 Tax=Gymnopilus dilepis TaxID=231916 RepID=A0A409W4D5_9AGAR|nr:hypothetical protein CVT26_015449 [Gymnopilus dilepis]
MVLSKERGQQVAVRTGLGKNFQSPKKKRSSSYKTSRTAWNVPNPVSLKNQLREQMSKLYANSGCDNITVLSGQTAINQPTCNAEFSKNMGPEGDWEDVDCHGIAATGCRGPERCDDDIKRTGRRVLPSPADRALHASWEILLPTLAQDLLAYTSETEGLPGFLAASNLDCTCPSGLPDCKQRSTQILCLYFDHFKFLSVNTCACRSVAQVLVRNGLFPTAPSQTRMAISIELLGFYTAHFEHACDAVNALAASLNAFYNGRGFYMVDAQGEKFKEPFRKGLGYAFQWLDQLRSVITTRVDNTVRAADEKVRMQEKLKNPPQEEACHLTIGSTQTPVLEEVENAPLTECERYLRDLCPACFGSVTFGRSLLDGGDFHICTDGNFHHRHLMMAGSGIPFHKPKHFIPQEFVEKVGEQILAARKRPKRSRKKPVPDVAIDECERSHRAAAGEKKSSNAADDRYDDRGYMSLVCRHDIPLFFANIDTPGEQQKFSIALILWFFLRVPPHATASVFYDVGCVLERSIELHGLLPPSIASRVRFYTTAMHAYGHRWACQLIYNPRLCKGVGLTDGEGVERLWSRLRKLIPIVRSSSRSRRLWLTDRLLSAFALDGRDDLGAWLGRRLRSLKSQQKTAEKTLSDIGIPLEELREQWELQKAAQLIDVPEGSTHQLDSILNLHGRMDGVGETIQAARKSLKAASASKKVIAMLDALQRSHDQNIKEIGSLGLYVSSNAEEPLSKQLGSNSEFVHTLRLTRDLKASIRKRAIGSFFELDRLDQAVGGRSLGLGDYDLFTTPSDGHLSMIYVSGTKLHQQTRKAIAKRKPALMSSIRKYNEHCATLEQLYDPSYKLPLPRPLPMKLADLRDNSDLMEDVWTTPGDELPLWLESTDVRAGIRAMLKRDRCIEELQRLELEAKNLETWFVRELAAVELALRQPANAQLNIPLTRRRDQLLHLKSRWGNPMIPSSHLEISISIARQIATDLAQGFPSVEVNRPHADVGEIYPEHPSGVEQVEDDCYNVCSQETLEESDCQEIEIEPLLLVSDILAGTEDIDDVVYEDTSTTTDEQMISMHWEQPVSFRTVCNPSNWDSTKIVSGKVVTVDAFNIGYQPLPPPSGPVDRPRRLGRSYFAVEDLERLRQIGVMLNDTCLNGCADVLKQLLDADLVLGPNSKRCALFSTYDLVRARYNAQDQVIWRSMSGSEYWLKDVWILPIHRPRSLHWVLCVAYPRFRTVLLYDSLADQRTWVSDLKDVSNLFSRLISLAHKFGHLLDVDNGLWIARLIMPHPLKVSAVQTNTYDCGLWVLAWITSVLRGFGTCSDTLTEDSMPQWRAFLYALVLNIPPT